MTPEELNQTMQTLSLQLQSLGIPVSRNVLPTVQVNTRAQRRLGCCRQIPQGFSIEVSAQLLEDTDRLRQTLAHELLHTCPGCQNHGKLWKRYAERVNAAMGMSISRLSPPLDGAPERLRIEEAKYALQCERCGKLFLRSRMCPLIRQPWRYRCSCGGRLNEAPPPSVIKSSGNR